MWFGKLPVKIFSLQNVKSLLSQLGFVEARQLSVKE